MVSPSRRVFLAGLALPGSTAACSSDRTKSLSTPSPSRRAVATPRTPDVPPTSRPTPRGDLVHGPRSAPAVALTFHGAGDAHLCRSALAALNAARAHVTVLAVGSWLQQNPALGAAIVDAGHDLGNHTWSHLPMRRLSATQAEQEIEGAAQLLERLTGSRGRWFRPSGTSRSTARIRAAARRSGYQRCLAYDVDPRDYTDPGSDLVVRRVLDEVRNGSIVSLHLGHAGTVAALPEMLDGLARRRLRPVAMTTLVGDA